MPTPVRDFEFYLIVPATDPTCSYQGTDCDANGVLVKANSDKAFVLTMATEDDPPSVR